MSTRARWREWLRDLAPPIVMRGWRRWRHWRSPPTVTYRHGLPDWAAAVAACDGYDSDEVIQRVTAAAREVAAGRAVYERDAVVFDRIAYAWPLLASLLLAAAGRERACFIDFGGALGTTFRQNRRFLDALPMALAWKIVEQPKLVAIGRAEFESAPIEFHSSLAAAAAHEPQGIDAVILSGVLAYLPDSEALLREVIALAPRHVVLDRTPTHESEHDSYSIQQARRPIYDASLPRRVLSAARLQRLLSQRYDRIESWQDAEQPDPHATYGGSLWRLRP